MNWSLTLNVLLLMGVIVAIVRTIRMRRQERQVEFGSTSVQEQPMASDEIIAVRKISEEATAFKPTLVSQSSEATDDNQSSGPKLPAFTLESEPDFIISDEEEIASDVVRTIPTSPPLMMFLLAKSNRQLAGYELLQAVLSAGFRFGEGDLFHRHQYPNGQGEIMCSLAAATPTGVFDLQHIGGFVVRGLCLFMHASGDATIDAERFDMMMDTAKMLSDSLDTHLLDDQRKPLSELSVTRYYQKLSLTEETAVAV